VRGAALAAALAAAGFAACAGRAAAPPRSPSPADAPSPAPSARSVEAPRPDDPMLAILRSHPGLAAVVEEAPRYRLQAVLGLVEEGKGGRPVLVQHGFRLGAEYFYPASAVKLFAAVAALERLAELRRETGLAVGPDTPLVFHPLSGGEEIEESDPSNLEGGRITVRHEIRKLLLVSDNQAFNRLYELVGQDRLAASLARAGLGEARIVHRLDEARTAEENRRAPAIELLGPGFRYTLPERPAPPLPPAPPMPGLAVGQAHLTAAGTRVEEPFDFALKNRFALADLQRGLCMVVRPDVDCGGPGFALDADDRALLLEAMSRFPRQSTNPLYDPAEYPDEYVKYLLPGLARVVAGERLESCNEVGQAYGFSVDNAWVVDRATGRSFFLAATLYTNADGVVNDDRYEYGTVARPFLADLGEAAARRLWAGH
jgi:Beta-lactamase enzyme family